jgi:N-acetylneuraminic acid mutarotase
MKRRFWLGSLAIASVGLISCGHDTSPTEPATTAENPALGASLTAGGTWTTKAPMPTPRGDLAAGVRNNSLGQPVLYAIGGFDPGAGITRAVEAYNFVTNRWNARARLPLALMHTNGVGVIGGKLYLSGGIFEKADGGSGWHPGLNVYDPTTNSWTKKADMPRRFAQGVTGVIKGKLYVLVGTCNNCGPERITRRLYRYDPATNVWTALARAPNPHVLGAGAVINGKFYVAGGQGTDLRASNKLDVYNPATNRWTTGAPMPTARYGAAGAALQNKLYVIGRANAGEGEPQGEVEAYDPVTNTWSTKTPMPGAGRGELAAATVTYLGQSHILAVGGFDVEGSTSGSVNQAYTP